MFSAIVSMVAFGFGLIYGSPVIVSASVWLAYFVTLSGVSYDE